MTSPHSARPIRLPRLWPRLVGATVVGAVVVLTVLASLDAFASVAGVGLPEAPLVTRLSLPIDVYLRDLAAAVTVGCAVVGGVLTPRPDPHLGRLASSAALLWLLLLLGQLALTSSEVFALPLTSALNAELLGPLLWQTTLGRVLLLQIVIVAVVAILAWVVLDRATGLIIAGAAVVAASLPGVTGHSGISGEHWAATVSLAGHIAAASVWVGGLVAVIVYARRHPAAAGLIIRRFSALALVCVVILAETGVLNASLRMAGVSPLLTSPYGALLLAKAAILIVLIGYGWRQRRALAAEIDSRPTGATWSDLLRLGVMEVVWMAAVTGLAVALSRTAPPPVPAPGDRPLAAGLLLLAIGLPWAVATVTSPAVSPSSASSPSPAVSPVGRVLRAYPEIAAITLIVTLALLGTLLGSAVLMGILGLQWSALLAMILLLAAGWLFTTAVRGPSAWPAIALVMMALPAATWWIGHFAGRPLDWWGLDVIALVACEACLGSLLITSRRATARHQGADLPATGVEAIRARA